MLLPPPQHMGQEQRLGLLPYLHLLGASSKNMIHV
jgi:hypothetical protein